MTIIDRVVQAVKVALVPELATLIDPQDPVVVALIKASADFAAKYGAVVVLPPEPDPTVPAYVRVDEDGYLFGASAYYAVGSLVGGKFFVKALEAEVDVPFWFKFRVDNLGEFQFNYSVMAAHADADPATGALHATAKSWTNQKVGPGGSMEPEDHIQFPAPGKYYLYLGVLQKDGTEGVDVEPLWALPWSRLSAPILITVS
jgi:hypothetical protein